jgi:hypothetical protein
MNKILFFLKNYKHGQGKFYGMSCVHEQIIINRDKTRLHIAEKVKNKSIEVLLGRALLKDNFVWIFEQIAINIKISLTQAIKL